MGTFKKPIWLLRGFFEEKVNSLLDKELRRYSYFHRMIRKRGFLRLPYIILTKYLLYFIQ